MTPSEVMSKLMSDPELAAAMNKPNVQKAIFEARDNQMAVFKYQDDPDVMMVSRGSAHYMLDESQRALSCRGYSQHCTLVSMPSAAMLP